jgi:hypothetical protein
MQKVITLLMSGALLLTSVSTGALCSFVVIESTKTSWSAKEKNISTIPLSNHFGNLALIGLISSIVIGYPTSVLFFKAIKW